MENATLPAGASVAEMSQGVSDAVTWIGPPSPPPWGAVLVHADSAIIASAAPVTAARGLRDIVLLRECARRGARGRASGTGWVVRRESQAGESAEVSAEVSAVASGAEPETGLRAVRRNSVSTIAT